ncbi:SRP54-type protein [Dunaliella salina]|uniref:SRP54-type protein n=1 Tax=Dunaliella salina TaxID=3046 RepID=A0ABQ7H6T0_DUNSA|nr:SRP54-type protein [Dunaliella salina]|eukprot:KAF5842562.1 SRP54-type protein [Dunaliella salina]
MQADPLILVRLFVSSSFLGGASKRSLLVKVDSLMLQLGRPLAREMNILIHMQLVSQAEGLGLVFVAVYQKALSLMYVDELLYLVKQDFTAHYYKPNEFSYPTFEEHFMRLLKQWEDTEVVANGVSRMDLEEEEEAKLAAESAAADEELNSSTAGNAGAQAKPKGLLGSFVNSIAMRVVGKQALSAADLEPALLDMKRKLMERNVAEQIAQNICDSIARSLEGQKLASFTGVSKFVRSAFEDALAGILNKRQTDVLLDIRKAQVGGAVEQLKTHCGRLKVPLYERGYEKDPAKVASEAIKQAERNGQHVVLVDTAGRMQDNEPLMRALSSLINVNTPNLVLFVGEALVGNDAVDQLVKFNRALQDLAPPNTTVRHAIDGVVLTKFDTIDDKVGAAVSMVYASGAPIMFLGCGQTYADLKRLHVKSVVNALLN